MRDVSQKKKVAVLGATGMLGAMVSALLTRDPRFDVVATARTDPPESLADLPIGWRRLDAASATIEDCSRAVVGCAWAINCIGITKPLIKDDDAAQVERAIRVNAQFPHTLATAAETLGTKILQIATDCVFSGARGNYTESSPHDALDVYGKTKSLGEVHSPNVRHLRASIIGPEPKDHKFLLDWFLGQPRGATLNGFTNHDWNGVTTLHFARVAAGVAAGDTVLPQLHHLVPRGRISKAGMLHAFRASYGRSDLTIKEVEAPSTIDRTLQTGDDGLNARLWADAGHAGPPSVEEMIAELAQFDAPFAARARPNWIVP